MTTLYIGKTSPYLCTLLSHPYLDMNDKKKVVHVIYTCTLPDLRYLPSKLVRYQVCFHLSCFSLPYLLLPTYMPDKPDIYVPTTRDQSDAQAAQLYTLPYLTLP